MEKNAIVLKNISKSYLLYERNLFDRFKDTFLPGKKKRFDEFQALKDVNLKVKKKEILGIVGRNGAGKSTLLKVISGITQQTAGSKEINGRIIPLLELGGGFNPEYSGKENIYYYCSLIGMRKYEIDDKFDEIVSFSELGEFINVPIKKYSSGMKARLSFSVSINIEPDILILDEVLAVGDDLFRRKCFAKMDEFFKSGKTILFVSHSLQSIADMCTRVILVDNGRILAEGKPHHIVAKYQKYLNMLNKGIQDAEKLFLVDPEITSKKNETSDVIWKEIEVIEDREHSFFVEGFESKERKELLNKGFKLHSFDVYDREGNIVNYLRQDSRHTIRVNISSEKAYKALNIRCSLFSSRYKHVCSTKLSEKNKIEKINKNQSITFEIPFVSCLNAGIYGINIQVSSGVKDRDIILYHLQDGVIIKVFSSLKSAINEGHVRLFDSIEVDIKDEEQCLEG